MDWLGEVGKGGNITYVHKSLLLDIGVGVKYTTKVTRLGNGQYGCRIFRDDVLVVEGRCDTRDQIGPTFRDMMRTIDKMGGDSFTHASKYATIS